MQERATGEKHTGKNDERGMAPAPVPADVGIVAAMPMEIGDVQLYQTPGGGDTITASRRSAANLSGTNGEWDTFHGSYDTIGVNLAQVSVIGRADTITASAGSQVRNANTGTDSDTVTGSDVTLVLNNADTTLNGSSDTIRFAGTDALTASGQSNAFVFGADLGVSSITGFEANERLRLSIADWSNFAALQASGDLFQSNNNVVIEISATNMLTLVNTQVSELSATDVKFQ